MAVPGAVLVLRTERPDDTDFLSALFRSHATPLPGLDRAVADGLLDVQHRSQRQTYRSAFPDAWFAILEASGHPVGRLVLHRGPTSRIVDYALIPTVRGRGLGTAILAEILRRIGGPVRNTVLRSNAASLAMCHRAGFVEVAEHGPFVEMEWRPSREAKQASALR